MPILGVDLGSSVTVLATVGRGGVSVIRNDLGDRLTPSLVTYNDNERVLGDAALTMAKSNGSRTVRYFKHMLGASSSTSMKLMELETPYALAPFLESGFYKPPTGNCPEEGVSPVSVLAAYMARLRELGGTYVNAPITDVVVAVPAWFTEFNREAVRDACKLADVGCLRVFSHSTATALDYGLFRSSTFQVAKPLRVGFVDIGHGAATVTLVEYLPSQLRILACEESPALGGRELDQILMRASLEAFCKQFPHFRNEVFDQATGGLKLNPRTLLKLEETVEKTKKTLSMSLEGHINIEYFLNDEDLNFSIKREEFVALCSKYSEHLESLARRCLSKAEITDPSTQLDSLEICGGLVRIPFIVELLKSVFQKESLSKTLSADECVARGSAIQAAILDVRHKVKDFKIVEKLNRPIFISFDDAKMVDRCTMDGEVKAEESKAGMEPKASGALKAQEDKRTVCLFEEGMEICFPHVKWMTLPDAEEDLLSFTSSTLSGLEDQVVPLTRFRIDLPKPAMTIEPVFEKNEEQDATNSNENANENTNRKNEAKVKIGFTLDVNQTLHVCALSLTMVNDKFVEKVPRLDAEGKIIENEFDEVERPKKKLVKKDLRVHVEHVFNKNYDLIQLSELEKKWASLDFETHEARRLRNEIISLSIKIRHDLETTHVAFIKDEKQKTDLVSLSVKLEEWAEENAHHSANEYAKNCETLRNAFEPIDVLFRQQQAELFRQEQERLEAIKRAQAEARAAADAAAAAEADAAAAADAAVAAAAETSQQDTELPQENLSKESTPINNTDEPMDSP